MKRPAPLQRRFTLRDAMILVVAIGAGVAVTRNYLPVFRQLFPMWGRWDWRALVLACFPALVPIHLGVLALQVLPPRRDRRRLARQPGFLAGVALATVVLLQTADALYKRVAVPQSYRGPDPPSVWLHNYLQSVGPSMVAPAIVLAWVILALQRAHWGRPDWAEFLGRLLGFAWIAAWVGFLILLAYL